MDNVLLSIALSLNLVFSLLLERCKSPQNGCCTNFFFFWHSSPYPIPLTDDFSREEARDTGEQGMVAEECGGVGGCEM